MTTKINTRRTRPLSERQVTSFLDQLKSGKIDVRSFVKRVQKRRLLKQLSNEEEQNRVREIFAELTESVSALEIELSTEDELSLAALINLAQNKILGLINEQELSKL